MSGSRIQPVHWAGRFVRSLRSAVPTGPDRAWAGEWLSAAEGQVFDAMDGRDQVHSIAVARRVVASTDERAVVAAALLHDVGKSVAGLGVPGRVVATVLGVVCGDRAAEGWRHRDGWRGRLAAHLDYPEIGCRLLVEAGSDPLVSTWAAEHHQRPDEWTVPPEIGRILAAADR